MLLRYYWGLGVGHTYSHVPGPDPPSQSQSSFTTRENSPLAQFSSSSAIPVSSLPRNYTGNDDTAMDEVEDSGDPHTRDDSESGSTVEWEDEEAGRDSEEEDSEPESDDDHVQTMYALYDAGVDSGSD